MAGKKKAPKKKRRFHWLALKAVLCLIALLLAVMVAQGSVVRVISVELPLRDLPPAFDGVMIVYISDIHLTALNGQGKVTTMMKQLQQIHPDLLLLGGDYTGSDVIGRMIAQSTGELYGARQAETRNRFFLSLADFDAPLGKLAVPGDMDNALERSAQISLSDAAALGGVKLLRDEWTRVERNGQSIILAGADDWRTGIQDARTPSQGLKGSDCVILLSHNPEAIFQLADQPGEDGLPWIDAALSGHTLGGLVKLGGYEVFSPLASDGRYRSGWQIADGAKILISEGLCGSFLPLRLGTSPQVHVITLRRQTNE